MSIRIILILLLALQAAKPAVAESQVENPDVDVAILMFDGVQIIDFAAPYEVFGQAKFNVFTVSRDGAPITTVMGLKVDVDHSFESAPDADIILVPGGNVEVVQMDAKTHAWLNRGNSLADILSICTGSFILAEAGMLDNQQATTFHRSFDEFEQMYPDVELIRDKRWVDNGRIITSAGLASGIDAALHVVSRKLGLLKARSIALHLEYDWSPKQGFVRGLMADRHILLPQFELPDQSDINIVHQVGDQEEWTIEYKIRSSLSPEELIQSLENAAKADEALTLLAHESVSAVSWQYESPYGGRWLLQITADPVSSDGTFRLHFRVRGADIS